jgi:hypothetical protein
VVDRDREIEREEEEEREREAEQRTLSKVAIHRRWECRGTPTRMSGNIPEANTTSVRGQSENGPAGRNREGGREIERVRGAESETER